MFVMVRYGNAQFVKQMSMSIIGIKYGYGWLRNITVYPGSASILPVDIKWEVDDVLRVVGLEISLRCRDIPASYSRTGFKVICTVGSLRQSFLESLKNRLHHSRSW
jgi:hypothetical protein